MNLTISTSKVQKTGDVSSPRSPSLNSSPLVKKRSRSFSLSASNVADMFSLEGKVAIVTGGYGVIGNALCRGLAKAGCTVGILGRNKEKAQALMVELKQQGSSVFTAVADVTDKDALQKIALEATSKYGSIDILVNCAGGNQSENTISGDDRTFFDLSPESFDNVMNLNFKGAVLCSQVFGKLMAESGSGNIVNITSLAAFQSTITNVCGYSAAKAALQNFTAFLATHLAQKYGPSIRVNAIAPGFFLAEQNRHLLLEEDGVSFTPRAKKIIAKTPMNRFGNSEELQGPLLFLCSDASKFVTGTVVVVDGGFTAYSGV